MIMKLGMADESTEIMIRLSLIEIEFVCKNVKLELYEYNHFRSYLDWVTNDQIEQKAFIEERATCLFRRLNEIYSQKFRQK